MKLRASNARNFSSGCHPPSRRRHAHAAGRQKIPNSPRRPGRHNWGILLRHFWGNFIRYRQSSKVAARIFDQQCRENSAIEKLRGQTIYDDYRFKR